MKTSLIYPAVFVVLVCCLSMEAFAQASVASLADYKKKQDDGIAETIQSSQERAQNGKLTMGAPAGGPFAARGKKPAARPAVIRAGVHPRQTGIDNRRNNNMR